MHGFNDIYRPILEKKEAKSVYLYKFSYDGQLNILKKLCAMMLDFDFKGTWQKLLLIKKKWISLNAL